MRPDHTHASPSRQYKYYEFVMAAFVAVYLCSNLIGAAKLATDTDGHVSKRMPLICTDGDIVNDGTLAGLPEKVEQEVLWVMGSGGLCQGLALGPGVFQQMGVM